MRLAVEEHGGGYCPAEAEPVPDAEIVFVEDAVADVQPFERGVDLGEVAVDGWRDGQLAAETHGEGVCRLVREILLVAKYCGDV